MSYIFNYLLDLCAIPLAIAAVVAGLWLVLKFAVGVVQFADNREFQRRQQAIELDTQRIEAQKRATELERMQADNHLVTIDPTRPILARAGLATGAYDPAMLSLAMRYLETLQPVQPVPTTLHYAPHIAHSVSQDVKQLAGPGEQVALPKATVGDFWSLYTGGLLPDKGFLMGYSLENGQPVTANWRDLYSALIGGQSGSGKSTLIRSILAQSAMQHGRFMVLDRHYGAGEESLGESLAPLRPLMLCEPAYTDAQMVAALRHVSDIGKRRLSGQESDKSPLILVVDETTALLSRSDVAQELTRVLGEISQEYRKIGVYALCIGQNFHSEIMPSTVRNSFVSFVSCRARKDVARVMSGNNSFAQSAEGLTIGQAVWMTPSGEVHRLSVPNCRQADIEMIAQRVTSGEGNGAKVVYTPVNHPQIEAVDKPLVNHLETINKPPDAIELRVVGMFASGATLGEIVNQVYGATTGKPYTDAMRGVQDILREYLKSIQ